MCGTAARVGGPNLPRNRIPGERVARRAAVTVEPHESDLRTVGRPARHNVLRRRWSEELYGRCAVAIDTDVAVIGARRNEGDRGAVGGPLQIGVLTAIEKHTL